MPIETQIETCNDGYKRWKERALFSTDVDQSRKAMERAFFWMELKSAFIFLHTVEQSMGNGTNTKNKIVQAKINLSKKLSSYLEELMNGK